MKLTLMRGWPGSGKSTLAKKIAEASEHSPAILSTDNYFINHEGKYLFDPSKIVLAHTDTQQKAQKLMIERHPHIIVDNTNIKLWEMKPYVEMAKAHGYEVEFAKADGNFTNTHGVPAEKVEQMRQGFEEGTLEEILNATRPSFIRK